MSSPRYDWWGYVKGMIRRYPSLCDEYEELKSQNLIARYEASGGHSSEASRVTENIAIRELPTTHEREYWAVRKAIERTEKLSNGKRRIKLIELVYWKQSHTLHGAALAVYFSYRHASRFHAEFIRTVAAYYGLLD